jgi:hypothetical protein
VRHLAAQSAHQVHVARARTVLHGAGAEEKAALEQAMVEAVEEPGRDAQRSAEPQAEHHVTDLADGMKGQQPLQIALREREQYAYQQRSRSQPGDHQAP